MYIDVLQDIEDAKILEEEKIWEKENVTNVRKEALGKIYDKCPPWSINSLFQNNIEKCLTAEGPATI